MSESWTCGQGLAAGAVLPAGLSRVAGAMAGMLEGHMTALDLSDPDSAAEHAVYGRVAADHKHAADLLREAADRMRAQRELPMGAHDMAAVTDPSTTRAFEALVQAKRDLLALLGDSVREDEAMLELMRGETPSGSA